MITNSDSATGLRYRSTLRCDLSEPEPRKCRVRRHTAAILVCQAEIVLSSHVAELCCFKEPFHGLSVVLIYSLPVKVKIA
jgi:hypothetical protein